MVAEVEKLKSKFVTSSPDTARLNTLFIHVDINVHAFVGQSCHKSVGSGEKRSKSHRGLKQSEQLNVLKLFNDGIINVLVATSVAEEGLDISEVDLIVFFDVVASPVRQVQRSGRTGRKRAGRIVVLASSKVEAEKVVKSSEQSESILKTLKNASSSLRLFRNNPSMLPLYLHRPVLDLKTISKAVKGASSQDATKVSVKEVGKEMEVVDY